MVQKNIKLTRSRALNPALPYTPPPNVFLLDPKHHRLLHGLPQFPLPLSAALCFVVSLIVLILLSALLLINGVSGLRITAQLNGSSTTVQGEIIDRRRVTNGSLNQAVLHYVTYRFSPTESSTYQDEQFVIKETFDRLMVGSPVTVKYIPDDAAHSTLLGENSDHTIGVTDFITTVLSILGICAAIIYLLPLLKELNNTWQLQQHGALVAGHITACHRFVAKSATSLRSRELKPVPSNTFFVELHYAFHLPDGKELRGVARQQREDLAQVKLPGFGTPVAVLYLDEKRYTVL
jgi:hypothetical protein